jgi:hypothetical protein
MLALTVTTGAPMRLFKVLATFALALSMSLARAGAENPEHLKAVTAMFEAMEAEKMLRVTASNSRFASDKHRADVFAKIDKVPAKQVYARLAGPVSNFLSIETAREMTRFYLSTYGKKLLKQTYNSGPSIQGLGGSTTIKPTAAEAKELKRPEYLAADKEYKLVEDRINTEYFKLLQQIGRQKEF